MAEDDENDTLTDEKQLPISKEKSNFARISLLLNSIAPEAVRIYFHQRFEPKKLKEIIHKNYDILQHLKYSRRIDKFQWKLLFPSTGEPNSESFDITLMICLLRNIMDVDEPKSGWDNKPLEEDTGVGANLTRIKYYRNVLAHPKNGEIDDTDFEKIWKDLSNAIGRLGGKNMEKECNIFKIKPLEHIEHEKIKDFLRQELVNKNFVETVAAKRILEESLQFRYSKKFIYRNRFKRTATLQHLSLFLQDKRYDVVPVTTRDEIIQFYNPDLPTVFVCDDFFGTSSSNKNRFQSWKEKTPKIKVIFNSDKTKIIVTGRSQIYKDVRMKKLYFQSMCVCNFSSNKLRLTDGEKFKIAKKYTYYSAKSVTQVSDKYDFRPLLCKTYSRNVPNFDKICWFIRSMMIIHILCLISIYLLDLMQAMFAYVIPATRTYLIIYMKIITSIIIIVFLIIYGIVSTTYLMNRMHLDIYPPLVPVFTPMRDQRR